METACEISISHGGEYEAQIALMMAAARTSETSVDIQLRTRQYIPEDSELHGDSMFVGNVGIDLQIHTAPNPKTSTPTQLVSVFT
jgi:hypothetical protein